MIQILIRANSEAMNLKYITCVTFFKLIVSYMIIPTDVSSDRQLVHLSPHGRIISGENYNIEHYSFTSFISRKVKKSFKKPIEYYYHYLCGAVIINRHWTLTAAHCTSSITNYRLKNELIWIHGNTSSLNGGSIKHCVIRKIVHPVYNILELDSDIALLKVREKFNKIYEKSILLAPANYQYKINSKAIALGWGSNMPSVLERNKLLLHGEVKIIDHKLCKDAWRESIQITDGMLCTLGKQGVCEGDSGGPLVQNNYLIGIHSASPSICTHPEYPAVHTNISYFVDAWIKPAISKEDVTYATC